MKLGDWMASVGQGTAPFAMEPTNEGRVPSLKNRPKYVPKRRNPRGLERLRNQRTKNQGTGSIAYQSAPPVIV